MTAMPGIKLTKKANMPMHVFAQMEQFYRACSGQDGEGACLPA